MKRPHYLALGGAAYLAALVPMVYLAGFLANLLVPKGIDSGEAVGAGRALALDLALVASFALVHSVLARDRVKAALAHAVPPPLERALYVLVAGAQIALLEWLWQPLPEPVWSVANPGLRALLWAGQGLGWAIVLAALAALGTRSFFGFDGAVAAAFDRPAPAPQLAIRGIYRHIRHPLYVGTALPLWAVPDMSQGHLLLSTTLTLYLAIGLVFEERTLARRHGAAYRAYREAVPGFFPRWKR